MENVYEEMHYDRFNGTADEIFKQQTYFRHSMVVVDRKVIKYSTLKIFFSFIQANKMQFTINYGQEACLLENTYKIYQEWVNKITIS